MNLKCKLGWHTYISNGKAGNIDLREQHGFVLRKYYGGFTCIRCGRKVKRVEAHAYIPVDEVDELDVGIIPVKKGLFNARP